MKTITILATFIAILAAGCASTRLLTEAQDKAVFEACQSGCAVVPGPAWEQIKRLLGGSDV